MRYSLLSHPKVKCFSFATDTKVQNTHLKTKKKISLRRKSDSVPNSMRKIQTLIEENANNYIEQLRQRISIWRSFSSTVAQGWKKLIYIAQNGQQCYPEGSGKDSFNLTRRRVLHKIEKTAFHIVQLKYQASNKIDKLSNEMIQLQKLKKDSFIAVQKQKSQK